MTKNLLFYTRINKNKQIKQIKTKQSRTKQTKTKQKKGRKKKKKNMIEFKTGNI